MIIEWLIRGGVSILDVIFSLLGVLPEFSEEVTNAIDTYFNLIFNNGIGLLGIFIDIDFVKVMIPIVIATINTDNIYNIIMWVLKKIPMLNIK